MDTFDDLEDMASLPLGAMTTELLITGAELDAQRAYDFGLVNRVTPPGQALDGALAMAERICASSPISVRATLAALAAQVVEPDRAGYAPGFVWHSRSRCAWGLSLDWSARNPWRRKAAC